MIDVSDNIADILNRLQRVQREAGEILEREHQKAVTSLLRTERELVPYRTGALHDSLHAVEIERRATSITTELQPGPEIFYAVFLVAKGGRLDFPTRTVEARPDLAERTAEALARSISELLEL